MAQEIVPGSVETVDNLRIAFVPSGGGDPLDIATLAAGTTKDITYSLTPDGWSFPHSETTIEDARLTLGDTGSRPGRATHGPIVLKYVYGSESDVAKTALAPGTEGTIIYRDAVANADAWGAGDVVDRIEVICGRQFKDTPDADGRFTTTQTLYVKAGGYHPDEVLVDNS